MLTREAVDYLYWLLFTPVPRNWREEAQRMAKKRCARLGR